MTNINQNLSERRHGSQICKDAAIIYQAQTEKELRDRLKYFKAKWSNREAKAVRSFIRGFDKTLTFREYDEPDRTSIKTNNPLEIYLEELQKKIKPFRKFVNARSVDRIIY